MPDPTDELYALPLDRFTEARNELATRLGDPDIRKLRKPSVAVWAVNQLARRRELDLRRLLRAGEQLEAAQRDAVGGGDQQPFEAARQDERDAVRKLRGEAAALLREAGQPASDATLERVAKTLHAGAATADGREALRAGRLEEELEPQGFDLLAAAFASGAPKRPARAAKQHRPTAAERKRAKAARAEADAARREAEEAEARVRELERDLERARRDAAKAADRAERLDARARELEV